MGWLAGSNLNPTTFERVGVIIFNIVELRLNFFNLSSIWFELGSRFIQPHSNLYHFYKIYKYIILNDHFFLDFQERILTYIIYHISFFLERYINSFLLFSCHHKILLYLLFNFLYKYITKNIINGF